MLEQEVNGELFSIGALAKIMGISTDTLRYYDEIGLLIPHRTSQETKYRYYTTNQAIVLARIMELKQFGFTLKEIKDTLSKGEADLTDVYLNRYWALEHEKNQLQEAIDELLKKVKQRQEDSVMNKKILIVDDVPFMRSICKDLLTRAGFDVVGEARDGLEAVEVYKISKPDIVLLDIVMPNCDGIDALRKIKEHDEKAHAVMISAMSQARVVAEALMAGAKEFVSKPFHSEDLIRKINESFSQATSANHEIAQKIYNASVNDTKILASHEVEMITKIVHSQADANEVETIIARLKEKSPAQRQGYDSAVEERVHINARLDKLEQGQEKILEILRNLK